MEGAIIVAVVFFFVYKIWDRCATRTERMRFLEVLSTAPIDTLQALRDSNPKWEVIFGQNPKLSLRRACLFIGLGLGIALGWFLGRCAQLQTSDTEFVLVVCATTLLFAGVGLLVAYFLEKKTRKSSGAAPSANC